MTGPYGQAALGNNISQMEVQDDQQDEAIRSFERGIVEPVIKPTGLLYDCLNSVILGSTGATFLGIPEIMARWDHTGNWRILMDLQQTQINAGGTIPYNQNQPMGGNILEDLGDGGADGESVHYGQVMLLSGVNPMDADMSMGGHKISDGDVGTDPTDFVILSQLGTGVPDFAADMYYQTVYDIRGNSRPVVVQTQASPTTTFTNVGRVPRRLTLRLTGEFRKQSDNSDAGCDDLVGAEYIYTRWDADSTGGEAGTDDPVNGAVIGTVAPTVGGGPHIDIIIIPKFTSPLGFFLKFLRSDGEWCNLKKIGSAGATRGGIQILSEQGEGT